MTKKSKNLVLGSGVGATLLIIGMSWWMGRTYSGSMPAVVPYIDPQTQEVEFLSSNAGMSPVGKSGHSLVRGYFFAPHNQPSDKKLYYEMRSNIDKGGQSVLEVRGNGSLPRKWLPVTSPEGRAIIEAPLLQADLVPWNGS